MNLKKTYDLQSLATLLGCSAQQLGYYIYKRDIALQYKRFKILKKSGDIREISSPATNLKIIQKNLERELSTLLRFRGAVNGFVRGRNIKRNASMHVDLPLNFHPAAVRASAHVTPFGAVSVPA